MPLVVRRHPQARRLTLHLPLRHDGVLVTIPERAAFADGLALARKNSAWIASKTASRPERVPLVGGAIIPLRGIEHEIRHHPDAAPRVRVEAGRILVGGERDAVPARLEAWLRREARLDLAQHVEALGDRLSRPVGRISVGDARSRWGSCSAAGNLSFSWRLILTPPMVLAYVVAHELAHLIERNHGPRFWALVTSIAGDGVAEARGWLRQTGPSLHRYG